MDVTEVGAMEPYPPTTLPPRGQTGPHAGDGYWRATSGRLGNTDTWATQAFPGTENVDPAVVFAQPGYTSMPMPSNGVARIALWMAPGSLLLPILANLSLILGIVGWIRSVSLGGAGRRESLGAIALSLTMIVLTGLFMAMVFF